MMIYVLLAAWNERHGLPLLLQRLDQASAEGSGRFRVVVVDDGSTDGSSDVAAFFVEHLDVEFVRHERNRGLGAALRTGMEIILAESHEPDDIVVMMDADDSHDPAVVASLIAALRSTGADVAIASRFAPGGGTVGVPPLRRFLSRAASLTCRALVPMPGVRDYSSAFRAFRLSTLRRARALGHADLPAADGFVAVLELLLRARATNAKAVEIGFVLRYDRKRSTSKARLLTNAGAWMALIARTAWRERVGRMHASALPNAAGGRKAV